MLTRTSWMEREPECVVWYCTYKYERSSGRRPGGDQNSTRPVLCVKAFANASSKDYDGSWQQIWLVLRTHATDIDCCDPAIGDNESGMMCTV